MRDLTTQWAASPPRTVSPMRSATVGSASTLAAWEATPARPPPYATPWPTPPPACVPLTTLACPSKAARSCPFVALTVTAPMMRHALSGCVRTPVKHTSALLGLCAESPTTAPSVSAQRATRAPLTRPVFGQCVPRMTSARQAAFARAGRAGTPARSVGGVRSAKKRMLCSYVCVPAVLLEIQD